MGFNIGKAIGGAGGSMIGGALLGPIGTAIGGLAGLGGSGPDGLLGGLFPKAPQVPGANVPQFGQGDQQALEALMKNQQGQFGQAQTDTSANYADQQKMLQDIINKSRDNFMTNISTGPQGQAFRGSFNNSGLLDSGAFNQGLASAFAQEQQGTDQALMQQGLGKTNAIQNLIDAGLQNNIGLGQSGLQRQFGLEDASTNNTIQQQIANANLKQKTQQGNQQFLGNLVGGGLGFLGGLI